MRISRRYSSFFLFLRSLVMAKTFFRVDGKRIGVVMLTVHFSEFVYPNEMLIHDHATQARIHSNSPCPKFLTDPDAQPEFVCSKPCPTILRSTRVHPSAGVFGSRVVLLADVFPAMLHALGIMKAFFLYNKRMFAMGLKSHGRD